MKSNSHYSRKVAYLIAVTFVIRCLLACLVNLGNDESYYFTYALQPDWNHFDHPPLVGIFIRIFTLNLHWVNDFSMRLTAVVAAALCTWIIFRCGCVLRNDRTGWIASILFNISVYTSIISGLFILPDSPQMVFWLLAVFGILKLLLSPNTKRQENVGFVLIGIFIGLATMCKIHGLFLWFGLGMYILLYNRKHLRSPFLYVAFIITIVIISPIFIWNFHNNFITWRFHSQRLEIHHALLNPQSFITAVAGQVIYNNPVNIIIYILALVGFEKVNFSQKENTLHLLRWITFPIIIVVTGIALFRNILPHWSGPGFMGLMLMAAIVWDSYLSEKKARFAKRWLVGGAVFIIIIVVLGVTCVNFYPGTLGNKDRRKLGAGDVTLDMYGWEALARKFDTIRQEDIERGFMRKTDPIVVNKWFPGGHILYYIGEPLHVPVIGVGNLLDLHKFAWLNLREGYLGKGGNAYFITSSDYFKDPDIEYYGDFKRITLVRKIAQERSGIVARYWYIYHLDDAAKKLGNILPE